MSIVEGLFRFVKAGRQDFAKLSQPHEKTVKNTPRLAQNHALLYNTLKWGRSGKKLPLLEHERAVLLWRAFNDISNERIKYTCCCAFSAA